MRVMDSEAALRELMDGNKRFVSGRASHPRQDPARRAEVATGQSPFAAVIGCSDSRVPPEVIFDCGLGDVFVLRSAGHVLDDVGIGTVQFGVEHLELGLVLVLGHSSCGAVAAAIGGQSYPAQLGVLVAALRSAAIEAQFQHGDLHTNAARANTLRTVRQLRSSALSLSKPAMAGRLKIAGGFYDLATGVVEILAE